MATLTIGITADAERRLREEAARRNASLEFNVQDDELAVIHEAVDSVRASRSPS